MTNELNPSSSPTTRRKYTPAFKAECCRESVGCWGYKAEGHQVGRHALRTWLRTSGQRA